MVPFPDGIGHGIIQKHRKEKDKETLVGAIETCSKTPFMSDCENGLWMDHFPSSRMTSMLEPESLLVCSQLAISGFNCAVYAPTEFLLHNPGAYIGAVHFCNEGLGRKGQSQLAEACVGGVGAQAAKENAGDYTAVEQVCLTCANRMQRETCMRQGLEYYKQSNGNDIPKHLCDSLTKLKGLCLSFGK